MAQKYCRNFLVGISLSCGAFFVSQVDAGVRFLTRTVYYEVCEWQWISEGGAESTPENPYSGYYQEVCRMEAREEAYTEITPDEEPPPPPPPDVLPWVLPWYSVGGSGGAVTPLPSPNAARRATCENLAADMGSMNCDLRRSRPAHQENIHFTSPLPDFMRPIVYSFHTTLWDDVSGTTWYNYRTYVDSMYQACNNRYSGVGLISAYNTATCKLDVDNYFGQSLFSSGFANFEASRAALDAGSSRYGQACETMKAAIIKNDCNNL